MFVLICCGAKGIKHLRVCCEILRTIKSTAASYHSITHYFILIFKKKMFFTVLVKH